MLPAETALVQALAASVQGLVAESAAAVAVWVALAERVRVPTPVEAIVVPAGMPGPEIAWPTAKAPVLVVEIGDGGRGGADQFVFGFGFRRFGREGEFEDPGFGFFDFGHRGAGRDAAV